MEKPSIKKLYSTKEAYRITYNMFRSRKSFNKLQKNGILTEPFIERIMLAVTEVNGCDICSYAHTKMALEAGLSNEEIENMLAGTLGDAPLDELPAIIFAQHYADSRGRPSINSWISIVETYGLEKAEGILGAIRTIMLGNTYGVAWSSFFGRFKGKSDKRSNIGYELKMMFCTFIFIPTAYIHSLIS